MPHTTRGTLTGVQVMTAIDTTVTRELREFETCVILERRRG